MPRKGRGRPNGAVPSTVPLNAPPQPVAVATGQDYGAAGAQQAALAAAPLPDMQAATAASSPALNPLDAATGFSFPSTRLGDPSERPDEPITAGLPMGPGPGPEILGSSSRLRAADILSSLASATNDPDLASLAEAAARRNL